MSYKYLEFVTLLYVHQKLILVNYFVLTFVSNTVILLLNLGLEEHTFKM